MDIKNTLIKLSAACGIGCVHEARDIAFDILSKYTDCKKTDGLCVVGELKGITDYTLMLAAHIDEVGFIVTDVDEKGFVTVKNCGGIDLRALPARRVTIHSRSKVTGVFCAVPPHLSGGKDVVEDISGIKIDSLLGADAKDIISVGDYVSYAAFPTTLAQNRITGKSLDDRAGVVCLLALAERLSKKQLPFNVVFALTDMEELGTRGAKTAAFSISPDEAVAVDVSFGDGPDIPKKDCGTLGGGAMIGVSPILDKSMSDRLIRIAQENGIKYQTEVMGSKTGTDSDVISISKSGVKTGLISIPLRNMHSDVEIVDISDIESVCDILEKYILEGGMGV